MNIKLYGRRFRVTVLGVGVYLPLLALLCSLGFWQLNRGEQKKQLLEQQQAAALAPPVDLNWLEINEVDAVRYRNVMVHGHYDNAHQFLLDNQVLEGKSGYFVMTPFFIDGKDNAVLVNRGWIPLGGDRRQLPGVDFVPVTHTVAGRINRFPSVGIKLQGAEIPAPGWPAVVQVIDSKVLAGVLGYPLHDFQIELDAQAELGYRREWKIHTAITPEKHLGYAVQWFALALALTGLFIWMSCKETQ